MKGQAETCMFCVTGRKCVALNKLYCEMEEKKCSFYKYKRKEEEKDNEKSVKV